MSSKRLQQYLSKKKQSITPAQEEDKDFMGEMAKRINAPDDAEHETDNGNSGHIDEQESDGSANAFETK
ncbi:hypothetical protein [Agriterribacter sp.]|uniref:hypothetical protein n=1 Tax=Agriterribacter sp. TaxID=2821509 RepID=UPI002C8BF378|nr:hypothetical protein [Agriterribacter sp.]HRP55949.1 hypothetical protein [Agriterribacter sp.]